MKIGLVSLGCPKNLVDSEVMLGLAQRAGHTLTTDPAEADVLVVNTCAFIESAREESVSAILELAAHKTGGRCKRLVVTGCMAERYRDELRAEIPEIDVVLGTGEVPGIVKAVEGRASALLNTAPLPKRNSRSEASALLNRYLYTDLTPRTLTTPSHFAYVKIAEGCNYKCSFCIIPRLRGRYRSRSVRSVVREANELAARGVKELILVSQDSTYFGTDRGGRGALARLLRQLNGVKGLEWIRVLYLYPTTITTETLDAMAECDTVCKYVDLPLQHASDSVLRRMRRPGTRAGYARLIGKIRSTIPGVTLRSTFIVGFPGETEAEFAELRRFVDETGFDHVGVFTYSHEQGDLRQPADRRRAPAGEGEAPARADDRAEAARRGSEQAPDRSAGPGPGRRPVGRAPAGHRGPAGLAGARHRPDRLSLRGGSGRVPAGSAGGRRGGGGPGVRSGGPSVARGKNRVIY